MVLYFPVSALVTLFGNILQNPLDPRARSDAKLMNVVVTFLSMLGHEAETGGVHRMLGICAEFERIAKVVIDKAEKENSSRRKRKVQEQASGNKAASGNTAPADPASSFNPNATMAPRPPTASSSATPQVNQGSVKDHLSPGVQSSIRTPQSGYSPFSQSPSPGMAPNGWNDGFTTDAPTGMEGVDYSNWADMTGFGAIASMNPADFAVDGMSDPTAGDPRAIYQQPMLPQDLFSLPVTLDWNWAEMSGGEYPSVENGNFGSDVPQQR